MLLYASSFIVAAVLLAVDQWAKYWTDAHMTLGQTAPLLGPVLELNCVHNYGVAWSLFSEMPWMRWVLVAVSGAIVTLVALVLALRLVRHPMGVLAGFLILSGGIGNLLDRIFLGYVVDMLHFPFWPSYPTFNVADMCVVGGCLLWIAYTLTIQEPERKKPEHTEPDFLNLEGANDDWQENWKRRQRERQGGRRIRPRKVEEHGGPENYYGGTPFRKFPEDGSSDAASRENKP